MEHIQSKYEINETSVLQGNVTGDGQIMGLPLAWVETHRGLSLLIALLCCWVASMLSVYNIYQHLQHYSRPQLQRYIVRILVIVPVYALGSFLSLKFVNQALYFDTLRDCYEAFVVYSFLALVLSFAGGESVCVLKMQSEPDITHAWPLNRCLHPIARDGRLLRSCKRATLQFVLIKPFFALLSLFMLACGQYHTLAYQLILTVVYNISYSLALYGLWLFYLATKHILKTFNPVLKFFAVKSVIFLTFWQSGMIDFVPGITNEQSFAWKDFVLCVEMVPFALLHFLAFNPSQFKKNLDRLPDSEVLKNMKEVLSLSDIIADAYHNFMPSYQDYMLQRADSSGRRRGKSVVVFGDDGLVTGSSASESNSPTPMAVSNARAPRFVIDDEDDEYDLPSTSSTSTIEPPIDLESGLGVRSLGDSAVTPPAAVPALTSPRQQRASTVREEEEEEKEESKQEVEPEEEAKANDAHIDVATLSPTLSRRRSFLSLEERETGPTQDAKHTPPVSSPQQRRDAAA
ncbi:hypothetical protein P43SY_006925 [Pythium insidiosum]|uniref:Transmembrane protein n=1 Tax=Pythium insidiosum TaxID=114742 RepID=A0AAD5QB05_PYTIN|nr:hypothetical protein P43SY_006925 [Pythium insidiosum]